MNPQVLISRLPGSWIKVGSDALTKLLHRHIPSKWKLPLKYYRYILAHSCEPELRFLDRICQERHVAIDAGANVGYWSYKLSKLFNIVHAFEINPELTDALRAYQRDKIKIINKGLSSSENTTILYIPVLNGLPLTGWASLHLGNCPDTTEHLAKVVHVVPLDSFNISNVSLIKVDVEGHEIEVLNGAKRTISQWRPVVIIEIKDKNIETVSQFFLDINYDKFRLEDLIGIPGSRENYIFKPQLANSLKELRS